MILAIIQARMSSSRLPGKVMKDILGAPMILRQIERLERSKKIDKIIVAISTNESDDMLADFLTAKGIKVHRGSLDDVLDRFYQAARSYQPDHVVRLTADCPLADWRCIDSLIDLHLNGHYDYSSNCLQPTLPDGLDAEVMTYKALSVCWEKAQKASEREHVTPYIYAKGNGFLLGAWQNDQNVSHWRLTVDEPEDYALILKIYEALYPVNPDFSLSDVLVWLQSHPDTASSNQHHVRNAGYIESLHKEQTK